MHEGDSPLGRKMPREERKEGDRAVAELVKERLDAIEAEFGQIPLVAKELSAYPDVFLPYSELMDRVLLSPRHMDKKSAELAAIAAGSALAGEHCLAVHLKQATKYGATKDEIREAIMIGAFVAMTSSNSVAFRKLKELD
jgi:AhpD family alkylhydroperoxidase